MTDAPFLPRFSRSEDIDEFVSTLGRFERGEISPEDFRRYRLTRGVYGQRQEGVQMLRVKLPQGVMAPAALHGLADVADRWAGGVGHVTTRQNIQFHWVQMADVEAAMRVLDEAGVTTREACGNTVRNVTACPFAGVHTAETFDTSPYGEAITRFFLRAEWANRLPRKFKIALSCGGSAGDCAMGSINDIGLTARVVDGQRGFRMVVAGGLSTSPQDALLFHPFIPAEQVLEACAAVVRVFDQRGNRDNKHRARLKYVLKRMGPEAFLQALHHEQAQVRAEGGAPLDLSVATEGPSPPPLPVDGGHPVRDPGYLAWRASNTLDQPQKGYAAAVLRLRSGAITSTQLRVLADLCVRYGDGSVRTAIDQNIALRYVPVVQLPALHHELLAAGLGEAGARTIADVTACPGAESCNLAVTSSRALATAIAARLENDASIAGAVALAREATIKISGCPNSCGQHHVADLGFHGAARHAGDRTAPVYQLHLGGGIDPEGARFGRQVIKIPARRVPESVARLVTLYARNRTDSESPSAYFRRVGADTVTELLGDLAALDASTPDEDFLDLDETKGFKVSIGAGECAA